MLLLLIYEILVDLALPIAADAATRASVATSAAAATVTAAGNGLVYLVSQGEAILRLFIVAEAASLYSIVIASLRSGFCIVLGHRLCSCEGVGQ